MSTFTTAVAASGQGRNFVSGYPPPPFYYKEYKGGPNAGRAPPEPPDSSWTCFGGYYMTKFDIQPLDSDSLLYNDQPGADLKVEFRKLYKLYVDQIMELLDSIHNARYNESSQLKKLTKTYRNMHHILLRLRRYEAAELLIGRLRTVVKQRKDHTKEMRECAMQGVKRLLSIKGTAESTTLDAEELISTQSVVD